MLEEGVGEEGVPAREPGRGRAGPVGRAHGLRAHRRPRAAAIWRKRRGRPAPSPISRATSAVVAVGPARPPARPLHAGRAADRHRSRPQGRAAQRRWTRRRAPPIRACARSSPRIGSEDVVVADRHGRRAGRSATSARSRGSTSRSSSRRTASGRSAATAAAAASRFDFFLEDERWKRFAVRGGAPGDPEARRRRRAGGDA